MTPAQWSVFGWCVECTSAPGEPCHPVLFKTDTKVGLNGEVNLDAPHPERMVSVMPDTAASMLAELVDVSVREGVTVRPGDTLVLRIDAEMFDADVSAELNQVREFMQAKVPLGAQVIVMAAPGQLAVIRKAAD